MTEVASPSGSMPPPPPVEPRAIPADDEALIRSLVEDVNQTASKIARRSRGEPPRFSGRLGFFDIRFISEVPTKNSDIHRVWRQCAGHHGRIDRIAGAPGRGDLPASVRR